MKLEIGDEIEVYGVKFILTDLILHHKNPPMIVFKSPLELVADGEMSINQARALQGLPEAPNCPGGFSKHHPACDRSGIPHDPHTVYVKGQFDG